MQLSDLITKVTKNIGRSNIDTEVTGWINDTRRELAPLTQWEHLYNVWSGASYKTVVGTKEYSLPDDLLYIFDIFVDGIKMVRVPEYFFDNIEDQGANAIGSGTPEYYVKRGRKYWLIPIPDQIYDIEIRGQILPDDLALPTDEDYFAEWYHTVIIDGATAKGLLTYEEAARADKYQQKFEAGTSVIVGQDRLKRRRDKPLTIKTWRDYDATNFKKMLNHFRDDYE